MSDIASYTQNAVMSSVASSPPGQDQQPLCMTCLLLSAAGGLALLVGCLWKWYSQRALRAKPLDPTEFRKFKLVEKQLLTKDVPNPVVRFRFSLPHSECALNLPVGQHVSLRYTDPASGKEALRSYTPTTSAERDRGYFDLVVKIYPKGIMGQYLNKLEPGKDYVDARGPKGKFLYQHNQYAHIGMIAGGSGITPMYQILHHAALHQAEDKTKFSLLYGNVTEPDIILRGELDKLVAESSGRYSVYHVLNQPPAGWTQGSGFITPELMQAHLPPPSLDNVIVLLCGPTPMVSALVPHLVRLGYSKESQIFCF